MSKMWWKPSIGRISYVRKARCLKQKPGEQNPCILAQGRHSWISSDLLHDLDFDLGVPVLLRQAHERTTHSEVDDCDEELSMFALAGSCGSRLLSDIQCILC